MPKGLWVRPNLPNIFCTQTFCLPKKNIPQFFFFAQIFFFLTFFFCQIFFFTQIFFYPKFFFKFFFSPNYYLLLCPIFLFFYYPENM